MISVGSVIIEKPVTSISALTHNTNRCRTEELRHFSIHGGKSIFEKVFLRSLKLGHLKGNSFVDRRDLKMLSGFFSPKNIKINLFLLYESHGTLPKE